MSVLRILHVVPYCEQAWAYGGIPRLATTMTRALARRGHRVTVCTTDACDATSRAGGASTTAPDTAGVDVRTFPNLSNRLAYHLQFFTPVGLASFLRSSLGTADGFDIAHLHACHNVLTSMAAGALARQGIPYVVAPNGTAAPIERRILAKRVFAATVGRHVLSGAARVIAVSESERETLAKLGIPDSRIVTVPNPIDPADLTVRPDAARFRRVAGLDGSRIVLFLGKLTPRKGADVLVRAFAMLARPGTVLVIAGNDMGSGSAIDAVISTLPSDRRVVRTGLLRGSERLDALSAADVVVYPSRDEVFGLVAIESLLCGTPVIVGGDSGCGEIVNRIGGGLLVNPGDVSGLAAALASVLDDGAAWRSRARAAGTHARSIFDADTVSSLLERVYLDVLDGPSARQRMTA